MYLMRKVPRSRVSSKERKRHPMADCIEESEAVRCKQLWLNGV